MKQRWKRLWSGTLLFACIGLSLTFVLYAFKSSLVFFYTPEAFFQQPLSQRFKNRKIRLGGRVKQGSFRLSRYEKRFVMEDRTAQLEVKYRGVLPDLFREGQHVIVEGVWDEMNQRFQAAKLLTKHDEIYTPRIR